MKPSLSRRTLLRLSAAGTVVLAAPAILRAQAKPRVVVVGGGAGGATAAKYLAKQSAGKLDVTLVTEGDSFVTCFFSNHVIAGLRDMASITQSYDHLVSAYGIQRIGGRATAVDRDKREVHVGDARLPYDRLIVSPGIDMIYDSLEGYSAQAAETAPHAWQAGKQTEILVKRLAALKDGDPVVIVAPPNPYRCPPGPYERASVIAHVLKSRGFAKSRITILDPKNKFSKQALFEAGWAKYYPGMIEWYGPSVIGKIKSVDAESGKVTTDFDTFEGTLLNVIPAQRAASIAVAAGLVDQNGYCPIHPADFRSQSDSNIHVVGDASIAGDMPKSAFSANSQARYAAAAIVADLLRNPASKPVLANTCWSMLEVDDSVKIGAGYRIEAGTLVATDAFVSSAEETREQRRNAYVDAQAWYDRIVEDSFRR